MTKTELFLQLANPNDNGISRWVLVFRKESVKKISLEVTNDILKKLYPEDH